MCICFILSFQFVFFLAPSHVSSRRHILHPLVQQFCLRALGLLLCGVLCFQPVFQWILHVFASPMHDHYRVSHFCFGFDLFSMAIMASICHCIFAWSLFTFTSPMNSRVIFHLLLLCVLIGVIHSF